MEETKEITSWQLDNLSLPGRFFHLAQAYLECSHYLFESLIDKSMRATFSHVQVAGFLFEHSLELFLKGAITQAGSKRTNTHDLNQLYNEFKNLYPSKKFQFKGKIEEICEKDKQRPYSEFQKYPVDKSGNLWVPSFYDLHLWKSQLAFFKGDYERLIPVIKGENSSSE